jgi:23S rRNA (adenine2503-C2)-methyltransferase
MSDVRIVSRLESADGSVKYAFSNDRGHYFEAISFAYEETRYDPAPIIHTICLSSQAGCAMACTFCATGYGGFLSNLSAAELYEEAQLVQRDLEASGRPRATAFAMMGMGEPLMNYGELIRFFERVVENGAASKLSISTVGVVPKIRRLADTDIDCNLVVSFHSPYDEQRSEIIPLNGTYPLAELVPAAREYSEKKSRKVRASYLLFEGMNDSEQHARDFCSLLDPEHFEMKFLLFNPIEDAPYRRPSIETARRFLTIARDAGYQAHIDVSRGRDVAGGCGQLARRAADEALEISA